VSSPADELMAGMGLEFAGVPVTQGDETAASAGGSPDDSEGEAAAADATTGEVPTSATESTEGESETAPADEDEPEMETGEDGTSVLGKYEQSVVEALKSNPDTKGYAKRVAKAFELAVSRREALAAKESELAERDESLKQLEARLQEAAEASTVAPAGPLAHLSTPDALANEVTKAAQFLEWVENTPDAADSYQDTAQATAQEQLDYWKRYALRVLKHQSAQAKVLEEREKVRAEVKKQRPTLFDARHEESKVLQDFYKSDPRTRSDFDQWIADAIRGRQIREQAAKGLSVVKPAGKEVAAAVVKKPVSKADLPKPSEVRGLPVQKAGASPREQVEAKLKQHGGVTFDEMADAGMLGRHMAAA